MLEITPTSVEAMVGFDNFKKLLNFVLGEPEGHYAEIDQPTPTSLREQYEKKIKDLENEIIHLRKKHKKKKGRKHHNVEKVEKIF